MCLLFPNTSEYRVKFFLHHHQKILKHFLLKKICRHIDSYILQLVLLETLWVNSYFSSTVDNTYQGPVIAFSVQLLEFFSLRQSCLNNQPFLLLLICFSYEANYNTKSICDNLFDL